MIGNHLSHYRILNKLGAGGMGGVYLAEDTSHDRRVALKVLPPELNDPESLQRFEREARMLAALDHPDIVKIFSIEEDGLGMHFLTMEWVSGRVLSEIIPEGGLDVGDFFDLAIPIAEALAATHRQHIVHRDLKPSNIMVLDNRRVKILDFGLAKLKDDNDSSERLTDRGSLLGSMPYMSPEQVQGEEITPASDVFSLGILFFQMLTGARPFNGRAWAAAMAILRETPEKVSTLRPEVPERLVDVIDRCLQKEAEVRYPSAVELTTALAAAGGRADSMDDVSHDLPN